MHTEMKCLVIGGGGREHAIAWKLAQSANVAHVFVAPGNAGTATEHKISNIDIAATDISQLAEFAERESIDVTIVGPEAPLVAGICDDFNTRNLPIFGPSAAAAELEGSKSYAKQFMQRHGIPTANYAKFTDLAEAHAYLETRQYPQVIKADGLAAGKGVFIVSDKAAAQKAATACLEANQFGDAGARIIVEDFLQGEEASFIVMVDGENILPLASSQDHKARDNGDQGPNTGGMGAYSPAPVVTEAMHQRIMEQVIQPTVKGAASDGHPYRGFLYAGLMISEAGDIKVLEFNCRMGDPETQVILPRLASDFAELCLAGATGKFDQISPPQWHDDVCLGVVLAAGGYPADYRKGDNIQGLDQVAAQANDGIKCFHAGTAQKAENIVTNGGRVLCLTARGGNVSDAQRRAYAAVKSIDWQDIYYRTDIGHRAIAKTMEQLKE